MDYFDTDFLSVAPSYLTIMIHMTLKFYNVSQ